MGRSLAREEDERGDRPRLFRCDHDLLAPLGRPRAFEGVQLGCSFRLGGLVENPRLRGVPGEGAAFLDLTRIATGVPPGSRAYRYR